MADQDPAEGPPPSLADRKRDHLDLALGPGVGFAHLTTGLDEVHLAARALPERDLGAVDLGLDLWGRRLAAPLLISCMTGGVAEAGPINRALAHAAQVHGIALGLGSGRAALEDPEAVASFAVRDVAPDALILANIGVAQLHAYGPDRCAWLVDACQADGLVVHCNAVQEAVQAAAGGGDGDVGFAGLASRIADLCAALDVPVVVKEVGFGLGPQDVGLLVEAGVAAVDVAGAGGTNWARLEGRRDARAGAVAEAFADWGWPTADAVRAARGVLDERGASGVRLIASGGLRHGVDAAKALCLGADLAGVARGLLAAATGGPDAAAEAVGVLVDQLRIAAWAVGAGTATDLDASRLR